MISLIVESFHFPSLVCRKSCVAWNYTQFWKCALRRLGFFSTKPRACCPRKPESLRFRFCFCALWIHALPRRCSLEVPGALWNRCLLLARNIIPSLLHDVNRAERRDLSHNHGLNSYSTLMFVRMAAERKQTGGWESNSPMLLECRGKAGTGTSRRLHWGITILGSLTWLYRPSSWNTDVGHVDCFLKKIKPNINIQEELQVYVLTEAPKWNMMMKTISLFSIMSRHTCDVFLKKLK